jgi:predicted transcriptional regulator
MYMTTQSFNVRMSKEKIEELDQMAAHLDRSRNWVINEAVEHYLDVQRWQLSHIEEALAEANAPGAELISHDEVMQRGRERLQAKLKQ